MRNHSLENLLLQFSLANNLKPAEALLLPTMCSVLESKGFSPDEVFSQAIRDSKMSLFVMDWINKSVKAVAA